jgi:hypothetical protein
MIIKIPSNHGIERNVDIINYDLTETYINIVYDIIVTYKGNSTTVSGIPIFLIGKDFDTYKNLPINEMLTKILYNYL